MIFFLLFLLAAIAVAFVLVGVGLVLAALSCAALIILSLLGMLSSSALLALSRGKVSTGLRAFHYQFLAALGVPAGIAALWLLRWLVGVDPFPMLPVWGALAGLAGGLLTACLLEQLAAQLKILANQLCRRLEKSRTERESFFAPTAPISPKAVQRCETEGR